MATARELPVTRSHPASARSCSSPWSSSMVAGDGPKSTFRGRSLL